MKTSFQKTVICIRISTTKAWDACLPAKKTSLIRAEAPLTAAMEGLWRCERNQSMTCIHCGALQTPGEAIDRKKDALQPLSGKKNSFFRSTSSSLQKPQPDHRDMIFHLTDKAHNPDVGVTS